LISNGKEKSVLPTAEDKTNAACAGPHFYFEMFSFTEDA